MVKTDYTITDIMTKDGLLRKEAEKILPKYKGVKLKVMDVSDVEKKSFKK